MGEGVGVNEFVERTAHARDAPHTRSPRHTARYRCHSRERGPPTCATLGSSERLWLLLDERTPGAAHQDLR